MKIIEVLAAILGGAVRDGATYLGSPVTPEVRTVRQAGEAVSVMLLLDGGQVAYGVCAAVQYSGAGGRDAVFDAARSATMIIEHVAPLLRGHEITGFRRIAERIDKLHVDGHSLHTAIRYGGTQALLVAAARSRGLTMAEVVLDEYQSGVEIVPVPMFVQSGVDRYDNVEKMVLKRADVLPHGLINNVEPEDAVRPH